MAREGLVVRAARNHDGPEYIRLVYLYNGDTQQEEHTLRLQIKSPARVIVRRTWGGQLTQSREISWAIHPPQDKLLPDSQFLALLAHAGAFEVKHPCRRCAEGNGVFSDCSVNTYWPYLNGACTSCTYQDESGGCSLLNARRLHTPQMNDDEAPEAADLQDSPTPPTVLTPKHCHISPLSRPEAKAKIRRIEWALETSSVINHRGLLCVDTNDDNEVHVAQTDLVGAIKLLDLKVGLRQF